MNPLPASRPLLLALATAALLGGCGGGARDAASDTAAAPAHAAQPARTPQRSVVVRYPADGAQLLALARINALRMSLGLGLYAHDAALDRAAQAYVDAATAGGTDGGLDLRAGGASATAARARARAAGYDGPVTERLGGAADGADAIDEMMATPYHRLPLVSFATTAVGIGATPGGVLGVAFGRREAQGAPAVDAAVWPLAGTPHTARAYHESPNPLPENGGAPFGYAVSVAVDDDKALTVTSFTLVSPAGPVEAKLLSAATDPALAGTPNYAALVPRAPLQAGVTYTASVRAIVEGRPFTRTWSFTAG